MKNSLLLSSFMLIYAAQTCAQRQEPILAAGAVVQLVSNQFSFTEGPAVDKNGNIYFTDQPNNKIWKYGIDGKLTVALEKAGRSNGTYFDQHGNLITCADEQGQLWKVHPDGKVTVILKDFGGHQFNGPNDLWIDPKGGIYFTDPYFQRDYWKRKNPDPGMKGENVYYLKEGILSPLVADNDLAKPNGIVGSPDGKNLYVSDIGKRIIYKYQIEKDGSLANREVFVNDLADGITLDNRGNLYLAGKGVTVYDSMGKQVLHVDVPSPWTANLCFGGKDGNILFITATESVYILPTLVKGVE